MPIRIQLDLDNDDHDLACSHLAWEPFLDLQAAHPTSRADRHFRRTGRVAMGSPGRHSNTDRRHNAVVRVLGAWIAQALDWPAPRMAADSCCCSHSFELVAGHSYCVNHYSRYRCHTVDRNRGRRACQARHSSSRHSRLGTVHRHSNSLD